MPFSVVAASTIIEAVSCSCCFPSLVVDDDWGGVFTVVGVVLVKVGCFCVGIILVDVMLVVVVIVV